MVLKELIFISFHFWMGVVFLKELIFTVSNLGGHGGLEISDFLQFLLWVGVVVLKELIFISFHFWSVWWF